MSLKNVLSAAASYLISQEQGPGDPPGDPPNAWDINYYTFGANIQIYQVTEDTFGNGLFFKPDGTKLYYVGNNTDGVYQYSLSTPWDLNTVTYDSKNASVGSQETTPTNIFFKPDGSSFYITGTATDKVHQYNMTTAWDVSTASFFGSKATTVTEATPTGLYFKPDGTSYYICGPSSDLVRQFNLATAWDITSTTTVGPTSPNLGSLDSASESLFFNEDGTKMYVFGDNRQGVWQYLLSTAWDVSTATADRRLPTNYISTLNPRAMCLGNNGNYIYLLITNAIFRITLDSSYSLYVNYWTGYTNDYISNSLTGTNPTFVSPDGTKAYMAYALNDVIYQYSMSTANDLSTLSYDNKSLDASSFSTIINTINFSQNGTHLYLCGSTAVYYYTLSTAFDISTATYQNSWTSSQDSSGGGLVVSSDGTKMIYLGLVTDDLFEYNLSTPYQPTSASYVRNLALSTTSSISIAAKPDGTKIFVLDVSSNDYILSISLPTAWSLSGTSTTSRTFSPQTTLANGLSLRSLSFNSNGSNLYLYISNANALQKWSVL